MVDKTPVDVDRIDAVVDKLFDDYDKPTRTTINVNETVLVKLTPNGYQYVYDYFVDLFGKDKNIKLTQVMASVEISLNSRKQEDGYYEFQLWDLMLIFGPKMFMGNVDLPYFEDNNIVYDVKE